MSCIMANCPLGFLGRSVTVFATHERDTNSGILAVRDVG